MDSHKYRLLSPCTTQLPRIKKRWSQHNQANNNCNLFQSNLWGVYWQRFSIFTDNWTPPMDYYNYTDPQNVRPNSREVIKAVITGCLADLENLENWQLFRKIRDKPGKIREIFHKWTTNLEKSGKFIYPRENFRKFFHFYGEFQNFENSLQKKTRIYFS